MRCVAVNHPNANGTHRVVLDELEEGHQLVHMSAPAGRHDNAFHRCRHRIRCAFGASTPRLSGGGLLGSVGCRSGGCRGRGDGIALGLLHPHAILGATFVCLRIATGTSDRFARRLTHGLATLRTAHRAAIDEHPPHVRYRLAADEAAFIEQPVVVPVELLERIIRQHASLGLVGNREHERVAATNRPGGGSDQLVVGYCLVEIGDLGLVDAMTKSCVDDHRDDRVRIGLDERHDGIVKLSETGRAAPLGCDIRAVDHKVARLLERWHVNQSFLRRQR